MAEYHLKPGKLGKKVVDAYQKTQQAFTEKFLEEDPNSPSGYSLKTGHTAQQAVNAYNKIEDGVVAPTKRWKALLWTPSWKRPTTTRLTPRQTDPTPTGGI